MELLIIDFFFLEYCFQSKLAQFLFYFYLLVEQICSYFFLFVFLVSFSIFFCQIYRLCSSSFNVGFFFQTKGNVHGYVFLDYAFSHQFSWGHGLGV